MPTPLPIDQPVEFTAILTRKDTGAQVNGSISPTILFESSDTSVFGLKIDPATNALEIQATGDGKALLKMSADCTFPDPPPNGKIITQRKIDPIPISVVKNGPSFVVEIG